MIPKFGNLWALGLLPVFLFLAFRWGRTPKFVYSNAPLVMRLAVSRWQMRILRILLAVALASLAVALADPQLPGMRANVLVTTRCTALSIDVSGSMGILFDDATKQTTLDVAREVALKFVEARPTDRMGLILFNVQAYRVQRLSLEHETLIAWLSQKQEPTNGTNIHLGILGGIVVLEKSSAGCGRTLILITDAGDAIEPGIMMTIREGFKELGIQFFWVQMGVGAASADLELLARETGGRGFMAKDAGEMRRAFETVRNLVSKPIWVPSPWQPLRLYPYVLASGLAVFAVFLVAARLTTLL